MPDVTVEIELKGELLPQLMVISAAILVDGAFYVENHCCLVRNSDELDQEVEAWLEELTASYKHIEIKCVVRHVPRSVYAPLLRKEAFSTP